MTALLSLVGLLLLVAGGEWLVRGASRLSLGLGLSPLVIGLTVVAFGTSSPELAVSLGAALRGQPDVAIGNVVGSNIANLLGILGLSAVITPLVVAQRLIRIDVPLLILISCAVAWLALDGIVGRLDGLALALGIVAYTVFAIAESRTEAAAVRDEYGRPFGVGRPRRLTDWIADVALVVGGLVLLTMGARWLVDGAVALARAIGVSELVIGLTVVAAGTSLPEAAASAVAAWRGERDIAVGNVVGSCLFNLLAVLGVSATLAPAGVPVAAAALRFDVPVMIGAAVACLPIAVTGRVARWHGCLFVAYYAAYLLYLALDAQGHDALGPFSAAMGWFVLPLTAVTLIVLAWRTRPPHTAAAP